jgi:glycosyltransferase involved in cell wall biosynthesis
MPSPVPKRKPDSIEHRSMVKAVRHAARAIRAPGVRVLVVSRGDDALLALGGPMAGHFPQTDGAIYAGRDPDDDREAIGQLEAMRVKGATHLLIPESSFWWLDRYRLLRTYLESCYRQVHRNNAAVVFDLSSDLESVNRGGSRNREAGGRSRPQAAVDVIVPAYRDTAMTRRCLESVLQHSDRLLGRLIVINDASPDPDMPAVLRRLARLDSRVRLLVNPVNVGFVTSCNRGLAERTGDAVLLNSDTLVTPGWLAELADVARSEPRVACVTLLSNNATICSVPKFCGVTPANRVNAAVVREACAHLPRSTPVPTGVGFCLYLRGDVVDVIGGFDPVFGAGYNEENDWCMRAQAFGFTARRANRAFVYHLGSVSFGSAKSELDHRNARMLEKRHPQYAAQVKGFCASLDARLPAHAVRVRMTGRVRVALDLRHLSPHAVGTNNYAWRLARELAASPAIELTLVTRADFPPLNVRARVVQEDAFVDDVEVIHKPSQVFEPRELELLTRSPAHVVVSYLDMIAYRAQVLFADQEVADRYRSLSYLALHAAQATIAISEDARNEIIRDLGVPAEQVFLTPCGVDAEWFRGRKTSRRTLSGGGALPSRYLLAVGTDFPHKNLPNLLEAYALFRSSWATSAAPALVLAGHRTSYPWGLYRRLATDRPPGVVFVGAVADEDLRRLYRGAEAFVFPSVYEGFGMPLLEAMAAGTPVVAMRISSVPEVGEGGVLYADGFSAASLAKAMLRVCTDVKLRDRLIASGADRATAFRWRRTAAATIEVYKSVVLRPSERSVLARRHLAQALPGYVAQVGTADAISSTQYEELIRRIRRKADRVLVPARAVLVISKGDDKLLQFARNPGWHFPQAQNGGYAGHYPATAEEVVTHLEDLRRKGGRFLLVPRTAFWWLEHYARFGKHLANHYARVWQDEDCVIFRLTRTPTRKHAARSRDVRRHGGRRVVVAVRERASSAGRIDAGAEPPHADGAFRRRRRTQHAARQRPQS